MRTLGKKQAMSRTEMSVSQIKGVKIMFFSIDVYCEALKKELLAAFGERLCYMGLQGSYMRAEATDRSDIDIMVILDTLSASDMDIYRNILTKVGHSDRACGFICNRADMKNWNPLEACQLGFTTKDLYGELAAFLPEWTREDELNYIKLSLNNLYHALCHGYIHADREKFKSKLPALAKAAFFILQNTHYLESGEFLLTRTELLNKLDGEDKAVMETVLSDSDSIALDFKTHFNRLLGWCQEKLKSIK